MIVSRKRPPELNSSGGTPYLPAVLFALLSVAYVLWFYWPAGTPDAPTVAYRLRISTLALLVSPDVLAATWFGDGEPLAILDRAPVAGVALLILTAAFGWGSLLLRRLMPSLPLLRLEHFVFSASAGLSLLSLFTLLAGLAGRLHYAIVFWCLLLYGVALAIAEIALRRGRVNMMETNSNQLHAPFRTWAHWLAPLGFAVFALVILLGGMLPPWDFDVREYHLQAPKEWFEQGRIGFMPHNIYANMPLGAEMQALLAMTVMPGERGWWYGALAGKTVMACFSLITALSLVSAGRRFLSSELSGWIGAIVYLAQPWIVHTSIQGLNEPAVANYAWLAVYACLLGEQNARQDSRWREFTLAGLFAGSAVACKYPAVLFVAAPLGVWLVFETLRRRPRDFRPPLAFFLGALVTCGPWLAKNAVLTGNPTYPLLVSVFDGRTRTPEKDAQWRKAHQVPVNAHGQRYSPAQLMHAARLVLIDSEYLSLLLVPLLGGLLIALAIRRPGNAFLGDAPPLPTGPLGLVTGLLLFHLGVWWLATHRIDRFWVPALPYAAFLASAALIVRREPPWRWSITGFVVVGLVLSWLFVASPAIGDNRWFVALEALRTDAAAGDNDPQRRMSAAHAWLNEQAQPSEAVLLVGDAQPFDLELPAFYSTCFDDCLLVEWTRDRTPAERRKELLSRGIQYVLIDWGEIDRYRAPGNYGFPAGMTRELTAELVKQRVLEPLQTFGATELYRVRPPKRRAPSASPQ